MMTTHPYTGKTAAVDIRADGTYHRDLNALIREVVERGAERIQLRDVHEQRYIGTNLRATADIDIYATPGELRGHGNARRRDLPAEPHQRLPVGQGDWRQEAGQKGSGGAVRPGAAVRRLLRYDAEEIFSAPFLKLVPL